ncbi:hypothetical protein BGZ96_009630 [Linnemannia gamsii]|uniref:Uncharacterized protein n=1 Tax=Linnemannia gamsii TaxID=64522 RepID=A0ABQ7JWB9_9FUNG|nr:hypothetical protein BGZ96_009630 [Linnemannia gamsii]
MAALDQNPISRKFGSDVCSIPEPINCKCTKKSPICGQSFPEECGYETDALYSCEGGENSEPFFEAHCLDDPCLIQPGADTCSKPKINCKCKKLYVACGSSLPETCGFDANMLYSCKAGIDTDPVPVETFPSLDRVSTSKRLCMTARQEPTQTLLLANLALKDRV